MGDIVALCGTKCVDLDHDTVKVLGVHLSYKKKLLNTLKMWRMRTLSLEGKITIFKTLAISKIFYLSSLTIVPNATINEITKIQKSFLWSNSKPKIKYDVLGLKSANVPFKIISLQCSWIKRLFDDNFHDWKIVPLHLIRRHFAKNFKFHSNLKLQKSSLTFFHTFTRKSLLIGQMFFLHQQLFHLQFLPSTVGITTIYR